MAANLMIEELSSSLVREYLNRKGLKETLAVLDKELPRTEKSFNKRNTLARSLHIESLLVKKNKSDPLGSSQVRPLPSILESLVQYIVDNPIDKQSNHTPLEQPLPKEQSSYTPNQPDRLSRSTPNNGNPITNEPHPSSTGPIAKSNHRISSTGLLPHAKSRGRVKIRGATKGLTDKQTTSNEQTPITTTAPSSITRAHNQSSHDVMSHDSKKESNETNQQESSIVFEDIESSNFDTIPTRIQGHITSAATRTRTAPPSSIGTTISLDTAKLLRELVFGTATGPSFNDEWRIQGLTFNQSVSQLSYGIVQHKGGPCGLLACVQAYILKYILFNDDIASQSNQIPLLSAQQQRDALINAICSILWRVRDNEVVVALKSSSTSINKTQHYRHYSPDGLTEKLVLYQFNELYQLKECVTNHINSFMSGGVDGHSDGAILLLYSIVLSHTISRTKTEMDLGSNTLIGSHGYCNQEMINLILTGVASSNVFNGQSIIKGEDAPPTILRGVYSPCDIGFLTLFEHYGACQVGSHFKNPSLPIWVICLESHYTVLFGLSKDVLGKNSSRCFSLHYYDGLAHSDEPITLEINLDSSKGFASQDSSLKDLTPPLELIIKLRWRNCSRIIWNCEKLL